MITAAVDETALAADPMTSTIAAIRPDTEKVAKDIDRSNRASAAFPSPHRRFPLRHQRVRLDLRRLDRKGHAMTALCSH